MKQQFYILNGDALLNQLGEEIPGEKIVLRETMIDGPLDGATLSDFYETRSTFMFDKYHLPSKSEYDKKSVAEFDKIRNIPHESDINLWFEDDLFCQTNFWFTTHLLISFKCKNPVYLVRPNKGNEYSFGMMSINELKESLTNKIRITQNELIEFQKLWKYYCTNSSSQMLPIAEKLQAKFPFLVPAIRANMNKLAGEPQKVAEGIIKELNTTDFKMIFQEFCKRQPIYGFGDVQFKIILSNLNSNC